MKFSAPVLAVLLAMTPAFGFAQEASMVAPGIEIHAGNGGAYMSAPGMHIEASSGSASMQAAAPSVQPATTSYANADLEGQDFSGRNLAGTVFTNANLEDAHFDRANLTGADFSNATLRHVDFSEANLSGASLVNATLDDANLSGADLSQADLSNASLNNAIIAGARMDGATLTNVDMSRCVRKVAMMARPVLIDARSIGAALVSDKKSIDLTVNFDFNSDKLTPAASKQVHEIATAIGNPALEHARIMVEGHTDSIGSDQYNKDLSYRRASRIVQVLTEQYHVPAERLSSAGYGKSRPVASNDNDLGRALNRRVTLVNLGQ